MADPQTTSKPEMHDVVAFLVPLSWQVQCPSCGCHAGVDDVVEDIGGAYIPDGSDMFIPCETDNCGALIQVRGVTLRANA